MGKYWEPLLAKKRAVLRNPDWENMRANALTANIDDSNRSWVNEANHARLTREMWAKAEHRLGDELGNVPEYPYGNPYTVELRYGLTGFASSRAALDYSVMLSTLSRFTDIVGHPKVVVEIGGGYGGLAVRGMQLWPDATWWDVDFEEMTQIATHYVHHCREWTRETFFRTNGPMPQYEPEVLALLADADLVINTRSMMEMDLSEADEYIQAIQDCLNPGALFYCLNRESKVTRMRDWAWDDRWATLWREPWPNNPNLIERLLVRAGRLF